MRDELPRLRQRELSAGKWLERRLDPTTQPGRGSAGRSSAQPGWGRHRSELVIDRLVARLRTSAPGSPTRLELTFREGRDRAIVLAQKTAAFGPGADSALSQSLACEICGDVFEKLTPPFFPSITN